MSRCFIRRMEIGELKNFYKHIEEDFAEGEYAPYTVLYMQLRSGIQEGLVYSREKEDIAYSICASGNENDYVLISLLAVFQDYRGQGIGTEFLKAICTMYSGKQAILVEVEKPETSDTPEEYDLRKRRIAFYENIGFYLIPDIDYSIWDVPMHLMALPLKVSKEIIDCRIEKIMYEIYLQLMGKVFIHKMKLKRLEQ